MTSFCLVFKIQTINMKFCWCSLSSYYIVTYKVFVGLTDFLKVTGESEELCKVAGIFCELHKGCCKTHKFFIKLLANSINFIKLLANSTNLVKLFANFTNFVKCFPTSTNFSKLFVASRNFVKGCFLQNWQGDVFTKPVHNDHVMKSC